MGRATGDAHGPFPTQDRDRSAPPSGKPVGFGSKRSRYLNWPHHVNVLAVQNGFSQVIPALPPPSQSYHRAASRAAWW